MKKSEFHIMEEFQRCLELNFSNFLLKTCDKMVKENNL